MERSVAIKKLGRLLGKNLGYRVNAKAPSKDERMAARAALPAAIAERNALRDQREARLAAILAGDAEYQRLQAALKLARDKADTLSGIAHHYKITVGTSNGMFFHVRAEGDSWEDVIAKLSEKQDA